MNVPYTLRLLSVLVVIGGLSVIAAQLALALCARPILRYLETVTARQRERILYLVQIGPALLAVFIAFCLCLPAYLRSEPNGGLENVSILCLIIAIGLALWFAAAVSRGCRIALRTLRFTRTCRRSGQTIADDGVISVLRVPALGVPVALFGLVHPSVVISNEFANAADRLSPDALDLALAHERAHAAHRDNWKLLWLGFLPRIDRFLRADTRWIELWHNAADWVADDDAVDGDPNRSLLLADILVCAARYSRPPGPPAAYMALTSAEAGLTARIDRLTRWEDDPRPTRTPLLPGLVLLTLLAGTALAFSPWIYKVSEWLLHLGAA